MKWCPRKYWQSVFGKRYRVPLRDDFQENLPRFASGFVRISRPARYEIVLLTFPLQLIPFNSSGRHSVVVKQVGHRTFVGASYSPSLQLNYFHSIPFKLLLIKYKWPLRWNNWIPPFFYYKPVPWVYWRNLLKGVFFLLNQRVIKQGKTMVVWKSIKVHRQSWIWIGLIRIKGLVSFNFRPQHHHHRLKTPTHSLFTFSERETEKGWG